MRLKFFLLPVVISLIIGTGSRVIGQYQLSGRILHAITGEALPGATVEIHELNQSVTADQSGYYRFDNLRRTLYHLHVTHVGFAAATISARITEQQQSLDFFLNPTSIELQEVLVESNHFKTGSKEHSLAVEILDADYLRRKGKTSLASALQDLPGVNVMSTGVGISKPVLRGMSHNRLIVNNQGIKQEGQQWGSDHGLEVDPFDPGRIEIIKGPASLGYGSDGLGGVINLFPPSLPTDSTVSGSLQTAYQSNNHLFGASAMAQGALGGKVFRLRLSAQEFADYRVPAEEFTYNTYKLPLYNQRLKNTAGKDRHFSFMTGLKKNWGYSTLTISNFHQKAALFVGAIGIPRAYQLTPDGDNRNIDTPYQRTNHLRVVSNTNMLLGNNWAEMDLGYQLNTREEHSSPHAHGKPLNPDETLAHKLSLSTLSANFRYYQQKDNENRIWGLQAEFQENHRNGFEYLLPDFRKTAAGLYVLEEFSWSNRYSLTAGLRADLASLRIDPTVETLYDNELNPIRDYVRNESISKTYTNFSGSAGFSLYPNETFNVKINLGSSFRVPTPNELAINGIHHGTFRHELGNASLRSERGYQLDANISIQKKYLSLIASAFGSYYDNYIYLSPTARYSSTLDPLAFPEGGQVYQFLQNNAVYSGGELAVDFHPISPLHLKTTFEYVYNLNLDTRLPLPFTPPASLYSEFNYALETRSNWLSDVQIGVNMRNTASQNRTDRNESGTNGYTLFGLSAGATLTIRHFVADLSVTAQNLTNQRYINHLSRYKLLNLPEQGRNFTVNLMIPFGSK